MRITDDNLHGRVVLSADGIAIGEINKLILQGSQFSIEAVEIKLRKEISERFGMKRGMFSAATLEIPAQLVQSVGDAVILSATVDDLRTVRSLHTKDDPQAAHSRDTKPVPTTDPTVART